MSGIVKGLVAGERAADKAERLLQGWQESAFESLVEFFLDNPNKSFTIEQVRDHCPQMPAGADARAWGHITRRAIREGIIRKTGQYASASSSNGSPKPLYRYSGSDEM